MTGNRMSKKSGFGKLFGVVIKNECRAVHPCNCEKDYLVESFLRMIASEIWCMIW